jgi:uncharacterized protein (DUF1330 family)
MSVFAVFVRDRMHDPEEFKVYSQMSALARADHPMKAHVYYGAVEVLEGEPVDGVVIVEFPDKAAAHAWYDSPAYQAAKAHRLKAADYRVFLVEGLNR